MAPPQPLLLPTNRPQDRFYLGGDRISAFRSSPSLGPRTPEDWIASTTCCRNCHPIGLTTLPDGTLLADTIAANPEAWLGAEHVESYGADTKLLVKLLDAGERLPVHAHPSKAFAEKHVGARHGKAEAWYILSPGEILLGLKRRVTVDELYALIETQDVDALTALMHRVRVAPHTTVYVPPGTLHAIGAGILLVEVQEPEDLSILLEWRGFQIDGWKDGHLGLDPKVALSAVATDGLSEDEVRALCVSGGGDGERLVRASAEFFRLERVRVNGADVKGEAGFAILVVLEGEVEVGFQGAEGLRMPRGCTAVVPFCAGGMVVKGHGEMLVARPPLPT